MKTHTVGIRRWRALGAGLLASVAALVGAARLARQPAVPAAHAADAPAPTPAVEAAKPAAAPVWRTAMDLIANRVHASVYVGDSLSVDAGSPDFVKYIDGGWKTSWILGEKDEGRAAALVNGLSAQLFLPVDSPADATLAFTARALAPKQKVSIFVNEKPAGTLDIDGTAKRYTTKVGAASLKAGDNRVRFTFKAAANVGKRRSAAAFYDLTMGPAAAGEPPAPGKLEAKTATLGGAAKPSLTVAGKDARLSYYVAVPEGAVLAVSYGAEAPGAKVVVRVAVDGQATRQLAAGDAGNKWTDVNAPLGAAAGRAARIDLVAQGGPVLWAQPRLVVKAPPPPPVPPTPHFDHIYVWMVDTLRADKMHVYNPKTRVQTPNYDAFAADATRFEWAQVPGTWSLPSHASLLTGVYPSVHKATAHEAKLSRDVPFIAEELKKHGYRTGIFSSNGYVSGKWGFERGWDVYRNFIRENLPNGADYLWKTGKAWVLQNEKKKEFVYLATVEPHVIYNPKPEFLKKYWNKPYKGPIKPTQSGVQLGYIKSGKLKVNANDLEYLEALHDGEITQSDAAFATFIADLKAAGLYDKAAIIVVSDHGDEFKEHGDLGHGQSVYQELTHVPLLIRAPGRMPIGKVVHTDVEIMDLFSTFLDLAGAKPGPGLMQGASLIPVSWDETAFAPTTGVSIDGQVALGVKVGRYRLVAVGTRLELYDEIEDRTEQKDVAGERPIALRQMRSVMGLLHANETTWRKTHWGSPSNLTPAFNKDAGW